jgi:hypothetical protein
MIRYKSSKQRIRAVAGAGAFALLSGAWMSSGHGRSVTHQHRAVIVRLTSAGIDGVTSDSVRVIVYASGPARVGVGGAEPTPLTDTLRLSSLPAITADVSEGDVHVRLLTPGRMRLSAEVSGGRAIRFTATGRHVVVLKGGTGADTITDP